MSEIKFQHGDERYTKYLDGQFGKGLGIQVFRRLNGMTQEELARQIGVTVKVISDMENGRTGCSPERLSQIGEVLGVSPSHILNPSEDEVSQASYTAIQSGHTVHRMVLKVDHEKSPKYPKPWTRDYVTDVRGAHNILENSPEKIVVLDRAPTMKELGGDITYIYGPGNVLYIPCGTFSPLVKRIPNKYELREIVLGKYLEFGQAIKAFSHYRKMDFKTLCGKAWLTEEALRYYENARGDQLEENSYEWTKICKIEEALQLPRFHLIAFTTQGRELLVKRIDVFHSPSDT